MQSVLDEVLGDIANSADILESGLNEHVFDEAVEDPMLVKYSTPVTLYLLVTHICAYVSH